MKPVIPVFRIFNETLAKAFYIDFLGFKLDWEHRHDKGLPLYAQISRDGCILHLSEHHGDCTPGSRIRIEIPQLDAYLEQLRAAKNPSCMPGDPVKQPWGLTEVDITDPFGNNITLVAG